MLRIGRVTKKCKAYSLTYSRLPTSYMINIKIFLEKNEAKCLYKNNICFGR